MLEGYSLRAKSSEHPIDRRRCPKRSSARTSTQKELLRWFFRQYVPPGVPVPLRGRYRTLEEAGCDSSPVTVECAPRSRRHAELDQSDFRGAVCTSRVGVLAFCPVPITPRSIRLNGCRATSVRVLARNILQHRDLLLPVPHRHIPQHVLADAVLGPNHGNKFAEKVGVPLA